MPDQNDLLAHFDNPEAVARYAEVPSHFVPGFSDLHRLSGLLLAESAPEDARVLVLGAGGGLELTALAERYPGWSFDGIDPAPRMLKLAEQTMGPLAARARLQMGYIDDAPEGPFDGAVCLLTLHFLPHEERRRTIAEVRRRLRPGAPFVTAHCSFPQDAAGRRRWLSRYAAFAVSRGVDPDTAEGARATVEAHLHTLDPAQDEAILREAGFEGVELFYTAFTWRGWVAYAVPAPSA